LLDNVNDDDGERQHDSGEGMMMPETDGVIVEDFESNDDATDRKRPEEVQMS
jgi:hypothetical protein